MVDSLEATNGMDARLAANLCRGVVITTPNADFIPQPRLGTVEVFPRSDLRYGMDDATLWPQFYIEQYPHLAAIRLNPKFAHARYAELWWTPLGREFEESKTAGVRGLGLFSCSEMTALERYKEDILRESKEQLMRTPSITISSARVVTTFSWVRLRYNVGKFEEKALEVIEFQRNFLELRAALDYLIEYFPRMHSQTSRAAVSSSIMGCFTFSPIITQEFFAAGIPVWLIRSIDSIGTNIAINKIVKVRPPMAESICLGPRPNQNYPVVYRGPSEHPARYIEQHKFSRSRYIFFNPNNGVRVTKPTDDQFESLEVESHTQSLRSLQSKPTITIGAKPCMWGKKTLFNCALTKHISQTTHLEDPRRKKGRLAETSS